MKKPCMFVQDCRLGYGIILLNTCPTITITTAITSPVVNLLKVSFKDLSRSRRDLSNRPIVPSCAESFVFISLTSRRNSVTFPLSSSILLLNSFLEIQLSPAITVGRSRLVDAAYTSFIRYGGAGLETDAALFITILLNSFLVQFTQKVSKHRCKASYMLDILFTKVIEGIPLEHVPED